MSDNPAGPILDGLGVTLYLDDNDLVASAVVIAKVIDPQGQVSLAIGDSEGLSWLDQTGLLAAAQNIVRQRSFSEQRDGDDD